MFHGSHEGGGAQDGGTEEDGARRCAAEDGEQEDACRSICLTPSGNLDSRFLSSGSTARSNPSYTVVGIRKPGGGCGKGLMRKLPLAPPAPMPAPKTAATTSSTPLRIKRANPATGGHQTGCQVTLICLLLPLASKNASAKISSLGGSHTDFLAIQIMSRSGKARALSPRLGLLCGHYVVQWKSLKAN